MATILIIDDDKSILSFLKEMLIHEGFNVLTAINGKEGMKLFNDNQVDLVITDMIMPKKEGTEIIIEMKKICPDIKIIAMSGGGFGLPEHYLDTAKYFRAQYTFEKPFKTSDLLEAVYELLKKEKTSQCFNNSAL
jgi:DNA-binding NtrC family response regulator